MLNLGCHNTLLNRQLVRFQDSTRPRDQDQSIISAFRLFNCLLSRSSLMDGHYYGSPIENYEPDEYFAQDGCFSEQTRSYDIGDLDVDELDLEFGNYMRILTFIFTIFYPRPVFAIIYQSFGTFREPRLSKPSCPYSAIRCEHQFAAWCRKPEWIPGIPKQ